VVDDGSLFDAQVDAEARADVLAIRDASARARLVDEDVTAERLRLTVNKQYLISIAVSGWKLNSSSAFKVSSSAGFFANFPVSSTGDVQYLYGVLEATSNMALVRVEPIQLDALSFYNVELWPL
jgi:hypothetical protein